MATEGQRRTTRDRRVRPPRLIHLDTSFLIRALVHGSTEDEALRTWIQVASQVSISALAWSEFVCGPLSSDAVDLAAELLGEPVAFGAAEATLAAMLFNQSGRRRGSLMDCMIAAIAIEAGADLATVNVRDFRRFEPFGLKLAQPARQ